MKKKTEIKQNKGIRNITTNESISARKLQLPRLPDSRNIQLQ